MEDEFIKKLFNEDAKKKINIRKNELNSIKYYQHKKTPLLNRLTPRILQIVALLTFLGNLGLIIVLGFKAVQFYSIIIGIFSVSQILISSYFYKTPTSNKNYYPNITIVVPAYNEEETIEETLQSCVNSGYPFDKLEIIAVNDGSNDLDNDGKSRTLTLMYGTQKKILKEKGFKIRVLDLGENFGKREAMVRGFLAASKKSEIFITVDADSQVQKGAIYKIVQPFKDKTVGAVSGNTQIANSNKLITMLQNYMYWISYTVFKASESLFGTVLCCPGCFSAFRKMDVLKVLYCFRNETFCRVSEDRNLTNLILEQDKKILYHHEAIARTNAPETLSHFIKQQYRWKISTIYENLFVATRFINRKHPFITLNFYVSFILIFSWSIAAMYALFLQIIGGATLWAVIFWLTCMPVFPLYWAWKEKKIQNFSYGILSLYLWIFVIDHLNYFAFANLRTEKWGGKDKDGINQSNLKKVIVKFLIPFSMLFNLVEKVPSHLPWIQSKQASLIRSVIINAGILIIIGFAYYINLRLLVASFYSYAPSIIYYLSQALYMNLLGFLSQYWIGLIGMIIFGVLGAKIIQKISCKDKKGRKLIEITREMYPELTDNEHEKIIRTSIPTLSETILHQNDTIASPLFLLLNIPYMGKYTSSAMKKWSGSLLIKPIAWIIEILTMLILYRFFLRHFLLPLNLSSKNLTRMIKEEEIKNILSNTNIESGKEVSRKLKHFFTLQSLLNYLDHKTFKWSSKRDEGSVFWNLPLSCAVLIRAFSSLLRQRMVIAFVALYIATPIAYLLFSAKILNTTLISLPVPLSGVFPVTVSLVLTSFIVVLFLELPRMISVWDENRKKFNKGKAFKNWIMTSSIFILGSTISMILIGPELAFALQLTGGIPLLGETVRFMEEFIYGANGQGGIGEKILMGIQSQIGIVNSNPIKDGWTKPNTWKIEKNGQGVMPESLTSLRIEGPGEASSHLIKVDRSQDYILQFMADITSKDGAIDISIEEFNLQGSKATRVNRIHFGNVDNEKGIDYITTKYKPSSPNVDSVRIVIEGTERKNRLNGYVDGVRLSRVTESAATRELNKPHIILRFDDGWRSQALPEMKTDDYGFPAVYNIISEGLWDEATDSSNNSPYMNLQEVYKLSRQNQIGTHSGGYKDDNIDAASNEKILKETLYQYQMLKILGFESDTYASPNFLYNANSLRIIYRNFNSHQIDTDHNLNNYKFPFNRYKFYTIEPAQIEIEEGPNNTIFENKALLNIEETKETIDMAVSENATLVLMFHVINKAGDAPKTKLEMETTVYNDLLAHIHTRKIPVITFHELLALQEESLSDLPLNSFDDKGIEGEEGTYYPMGSVQMVQDNGIIIDDYYTVEDIMPLNLPPSLAGHSFLSNVLQSYGKSQIITPVSSPETGIIPLTAALGILGLVERLKGEDKDREEYIEKPVKRLKIKIRNKETGK